MMDLRIPVGIAAVGLLLLPLTLQFMNSTGLTGPDSALVRMPAPPEPVVARPEPEPQPRDDAEGGRIAGELATKAADAAAPAMARNPAPQPAPEAYAAPQQQSMPQMMPAPAMLAERARGPLPLALPPAPPSAGDRFEAFDTAGFVRVAETPVSTFSIDVDTASYAYVRRLLDSGQLPPPDAVRVEEMINYFDYDYALPEAGDAPFRQTVSVHPAPWDDETLLLHVGLKGYQPPAGEIAPANLVFLIDSSGSMEAPDRLPLLKRAFALLLDQLGADDTISIVTYAGSAGVVLEPTPATAKSEILAALDRLSAGGSTAGAEGIAAAYELAEGARRDGSNNRVILATDGDFNVGISEPQALTRYIAGKRDQGIFLSVLGFGTGNYNDALMQALAQNGNGNAAYIDSFREARKVLEEQVRGTLNTIASDVKIQIEFNPAVVAEYRLIGYETRALAREDFNNDAVDAGEIGAGHSVTALYELVPVDAQSRRVDPLRYGAAAEPRPVAGNGDEFAFLKLRYKRPGESESVLVTEPVGVGARLESLEAAPEDLRFAAAVAAFGQKLRGSPYVDAMSFADIRALAEGARGADPSGYRAEFVSLVDAARALSPQGAGRN